MSLLLCLEALTPPPGIGPWRRDRIVHKSGAKLRRDQHRARAHQQRLQNKKESLDVVTKVFQRITAAVTGSSSRFGKFATHFLQGEPARDVSRVRGVFPIPKIAVLGPVAEHWSDSRKQVALSYANLTLAGLTYLFDARLPLNGRHPTKVQAAVHANIIDKLGRCFKRLDSVAHDSVPLHAFAALVKRESEKVFPELKADDCDVLETCAGVDPAPFIDADAQMIISTPSLMFPNGIANTSKSARFFAGPKLEYMKLVVRHLRSGKLVLRANAQSSGSVFAVHKSGGSRLREIWNGRQISSAASAPPRPPCLGSPTALLRLESSNDRPLRLAKKDARVFFDQLQLAPELHQYMGRPAINISEIIGVEDFTLDELLSHLPANDRKLAQGFVVPCNATWAMGFSWSSFVGQSVMVGTCKRAGIQNDQFLSDDMPLSTSASEYVSVCTDDVLHFARDGPSVGRQWMERLDKIWKGCNILQHEGKAIYDGVLNGTALGIDLCDGVALGPQAEKQFVFLHAAVELFADPLASPLEMASFCGVLQWFDLVNRWLLSCLDKTYSFIRSPSQRILQHVPDAVLGEIMHNLSLCVLWEVDLRKGWLGELLATDACPLYGFGVAVARCSEQVVRFLAACSYEPDSHVRCLHARGDALERPRQGKCCRIPLRQRDFKTVLSMRARYKTHSGALEGNALVMGMDWMSRGIHRHSKRVAFLVDAMALKGACVKGRSSARTLARHVQKCGAIAMACDWHVHLLYVPTESNPSDKASRGYRRRPAVRRSSLKAKRRPKKTRLEQYIDDIGESYRRLRETGMISSTFSDSSDAS